MTCATVQLRLKSGLLMTNQIREFDIVVIIIIVIFCYSLICCLQIFTEDLPEVEGLPRDKVLAHIEQCAKQLSIRYLVSSYQF